MRRAATFLLALFVSASAFADPVEQVRQAEIAFAKAFADRDQAKFFGMVLDDATFLGARTLAGKGAVVERWSRFFQGPQAPFFWGPERVVVNGAGTIGLSTGPVYDPNGAHIGNYSSVWLRQPDASWKILFDGPGSQPACLAADAAPFEEGFLPADDGVRLHYRKIGAGGQTLILPFDAILFDDFKQLADAGTLIFYDMRNRGRSDPVADVKTLTISQDVKDLEAVRRHFKVEKFVPVGFSYLGLMVMLYAHDHPEHVSRIIQLGPVALEPTAQFPKALTHGPEDIGVADDVVKRWRDMQSQGVAEKSPKEFCDAEWAVMSHYLVGDPAHATRLHSLCDLPNEQGAKLQKHFAAHFESVKKVDVPSSEMSAKVTVPVLTIHGRKDRNAPYGAGREWAMMLPNARLVTIEGGAHASWADDPVRVFGSIREFLRGGWPRGAEKVGKIVP